MLPDGGRRGGGWTSSSVRAGSSGGHGELNQPECTVLDQGGSLRGQETVTYKATDQVNKYTEDDGNKISHDKKEGHKYRKRKGKNNHVILAYGEIISVNSQFLI